MSILWFIIGLMLGGTVGVFTMCLFQINRDSSSFKKDLQNDHTNNDKSH